MTLGLEILFSISGKGNKSNNKQMGLYQTKKLLHKEGNYKQNEKGPTSWEKMFANDAFNRG